MNEPPAHPPTDAKASHAMIAFIVWCILNAAGMSLVKIGFRPSATSEPISATSAVMISQILGAVFLFPDLLKTWWHTARVLALSAAALALAVRQDQANWSALPAAWLIAAAWTVCFALQPKSSPQLRIVITTTAVLFLLGAPSLSYLQFESHGLISGVLRATNAGNPLGIAAQRNFHFPPPISFLVFPLFFGLFGLLCRPLMSHDTSLAPNYPQK